MGTAIKRVTTVDELVSATQDSGIRRIVVQGNLAGVPSLRLLPGQSLEGEGDYATVTFVEGTDGLQLSSDNQVQNISLRASPVKRAIFNDTSVANLGRIALAGVTATGQVQILARDEVRGGHIDVNGLDILSADARGQPGQPNGYGVNVIQGAFTLWNMQPEDDVAITADIVGLSAGRAGAPVLGSGIFVSGAGFNGGRLVARRLETGGMYSDGKIAPGTPDQITGGVFTVYNAHVGTVRNRGPVVTYGVNDSSIIGALWIGESLRARTLRMDRAASAS